MSRDYRFRYVDILNNEIPPQPPATCSTPTSVSNSAFTPVNPIYQYLPQQLPETNFCYVPIKQQVPNVQFNYPSFTAQPWNSNERSGVRDQQMISEDNRNKAFESAYPSRPTTHYSAHNSGYTSPQASSMNGLNFTQVMSGNYVNTPASNNIVGPQYQQFIQQVEKKSLTQQVKTLAKTVNKILAKRCRPSFINMKKAYNKESELLVLFTNHCATIIQKNFRRFIQQKYYKHYKVAVCRMKELVTAVCEGWRIRKIMKTRAIQRMVEEIRKKEQQKKYPQMRIQKRELTKELTKLIKTGKWVDQYRAQRKTDKFKSGNFRFVTVSNHPVSTLGNSSTDQSEKRFGNRPSSNSRKQNNEETVIAGTFDQMPLPTQAKTVASSLDDIPIKANPNATGYNFDEVSLEDKAINQKVELKKPAPKKKKVIKIHNSELPTNPSANPSPPPFDTVKPKQYVSQPGKTSFNPKIQGDTQPLDMISIADTQKPEKSVGKQKGSGVQKEDKKDYLKKRMKYDPRKAIQQQKKRKVSGANSRVAPQVTAIEDRSLQRFRPSQLNDITVRPASSNPHAIRSKSPELTKDFNATLKRFSKIQPSKIQSIIPISSPESFNISTKIVTIKSPTSISKQRHINLNELEQTYNSSYSKKRIQLTSLIQKMGRNLKKMSYPLPSIRYTSQIYRVFDLNNFQVSRCLTQNTQDLLEREFISMLNM